MRVLQLHARYRDEAGEDAVVDAEAALLRAAGHDVEPFHVRSPTTALHAGALLAVSSWNPASARSVNRAVQAHKPDVAHVHNTWFALSSAVLGPLTRAGVPVVMTLHNYRLGCISRDLFRDGAPCTRCLGRSPTPGVVRRCYQGSLTASAIAATELAVHRARRTLPRSVDRFIAPTDFAAGLLARAGVPADRIVVKPHFTADPGPRTRPCADADEVLYVGRLAPGKGLEELLAAWEQAPARPQRLVLIGDGPLRAQIERIRPPSVELAGWQPRPVVLDRMRAARALAFPSMWYEPFGMVLIEALASGLPVIGFAAGAALQIVDPDPPDLLAPVGDVAALARAFSWLVDDALVTEVGCRSRARWQAAFTPAHNLPALEAVYESVR